MAEPASEQQPPARHGPWHSNWFSGSALAFQVAIIVLYGTCTKFEHFIATDHEHKAPEGAEFPTQLNIRYAMFQDTHIMMLVGFGFLYTLLRRYAWSGVAYNYLITVFTLEWAVLALGFWTNASKHRAMRDAGSPAFFSAVPVGIDSLIDADYVAATVLISFGAIIGRVSPMQCLIMLFFEVVFATANVQISRDLLVTDPGGSMIIHTFGAAFGLAVALVLGDPAKRGLGNGESKLGTSRHNGTFAMVGTLFLFAFWPSFNAGLLSGAGQHRAIINTVLSICASTISAFLVSKAIHGGTHFDMEHVQNATLAGGVVVGAMCDMLANPWGALLAGTVAGGVSTYGFSYLVPALKRLGLTDTCGISSLHFIPGLMGGFASAIAAAGIDSPDWDHASMLEAFPGRRAGRSALVQGGMQAACTAISLAFGLLAGALTGAIMRLPCAEPMRDDFYEDAGSWNVPYDEEETPEQDSDFALALEAARESITADVLARLAKHKSGAASSDTAAVSKPSAAQATGSVHGGGGAPRQSANQRFADGPSVHGGSSGGFVFGGEGSVRGGRGAPGAGSAAGLSIRGGRAYQPAQSVASEAAEGALPAV